MNFSAEQFQTLIAVITGGNQQAPPAAVAAAAMPAPKNDPAALGPIRCNLSTDKMQKLILLDEWLEDAENKMDYIGVTEDKEKIILLKTWGGPEMVELFALRNPTSTQAQEQMKKRANEEDALTYMQTTERLRNYLAQMVNRTMAMHQLLGTKQGSRTWGDFLRDLEKNFDKKPYTTEDAIKDAAMFGMNDATLREKALAEDPNLKKLWTRLPM